MLVSFDTFVETKISCGEPRFPLILTAKFHSLYASNILERRSRILESEILERSELESDILPPSPQPFIFTCINLSCFCCM